MRGLVFLALTTALAAGAAPPPVLWPRPAQASSGQGEVGVAPGSGFFLLGAGGRSALLEAGFARYEPLVFPHALDHTRGLVGGGAGADDIQGLVFDVEDLSEHLPQIDTDESYSLTVPSVGGFAKATAKTVYGALRALETFSQLVAFDFDANAYIISGAPWQIEDKPRFPHRGLMIDTARHYQPLSAIRTIVDSLQYSKFNVLHWHMVDSQSFPFESKTRPKLWMGAYSPMERYTQQDIASIVEYARLRGVRVMVEFDMPGHADSWCKGYPDICPSPSCLTPLNVASNSTFDLIGDLLDEITGGHRSAPGAPAGLFPDNLVHLGGDEVNTQCWSSTASVSAWLQAQGMTPDQGYAFFVKKVAEMAIKRGRRPVQWSEVFDHFKSQLPKETIVHVWKDVTNVTEVVALGYNVLRNVGYDNVSWYLDNLNVRWDAVYQNDPCSGIPTEELCSLVLGGHGEMWSETVDASDMQQTVWPRLAAIGEKLWSPRKQTEDVAAALPRIRAFRCLLLERGIAAAPVDNAAARSAPAGPDSCYRQHASATERDDFAVLV